MTDFNTTPPTSRGTTGDVDNVPETDNLLLLHLQNCCQTPGLTHISFFDQKRWQKPDISFQTFVDWIHELILSDFFSKEADGFLYNIMEFFNLCFEEGQDECDTLIENSLRKLAKYVNNVCAETCPYRRAMNRHFAVANYSYMIANAAESYGCHLLKGMGYDDRFLDIEAAYRADPETFAANAPKCLDIIADVHQTLIIEFLEELYDRLCLTETQTTTLYQFFLAQEKNYPETDPAAIFQPYTLWLQGDAFISVDRLAHLMSNIHMRHVPNPDYPGAFLAPVCQFLTHYGYDDAFDVIIAILADDPHLDVPAAKTQIKKLCIDYDMVLNSPDPSLEELVYVMECAVAEGYFAQERAGITFRSFADNFCGTGREPLPETQMVHEHLISYLQQQIATAFYRDLCNKYQELDGCGDRLHH